MPVRGIVRKEYSHKHAHIPSVAATWRAHGSERQDQSAEQAPKDVYRIQTPITTVICTTAPKRAAYIVGGLPVPFSVAWVEPVLLVIRAFRRVLAALAGAHAERAVGGVITCE